MAEVARRYRVIAETRIKTSRVSVLGKKNNKKTTTAVRQLPHKRSRNQMLLQLDLSTKGGIIPFFLNSQELRVWWREEDREVIAALQALL